VHHGLGTLKGFMSPHSNDPNGLLGLDGTFYGIVGIGGALCLEFVNTHEWRGTAKSIDRFGSAQDVVYWAHCVGLIDSLGLNRLRDMIDEDPERAAAFLGHARSFREAIFSACVEATRGGPISASSLGPVNLHLSSLLSRIEISASDDPRRLSLRIVPADLGLTSILIEVAWSFLDLIRSDERRFVKQCAWPHCQWMFVDRTKNKRRRWCAMSACGGRAKAASFKARRRTIGSSRGR
jgi:predicted RNA-binding Zn ribbon-like protein